MAPEVLRGSYTKQADLWSIGVILYMLLSSQMPFYGKKRRHIVEQILSGTYTYKGRKWKRVSDAAKSVVDQLLVLDPDQRATAAGILQDPWFVGMKQKCLKKSPTSLTSITNSTSSIQAYASYSKLKQMALMVMAHKSTSTEIGQLREIFQMYDTDGNGHLSRDEFQAALQASQIQAQQANELFDVLDLDGTGQIRYTEFLASTISTLPLTEERLAEAFDRLDSDDSGFITQENLVELLGNEMPPEEIAAIITESDLTKDGKISYNEFLAQFDLEQSQHHANVVVDTGMQAAISATSMDQVSDMGDEEEVDDLGNLPEMARSNFMESKQLSERKVTTALQTPIAYADV